MPSFVLASTSPRRAALLSDAGFQFEIAPPRLAEKFDAALTIRQRAQWNAIRKGMSIAQARPDAVVLAADTLVARANAVICKPVDLDEATQVLTALRRRAPSVRSA